LDDETALSEPRRTYRDKLIWKNLDLILRALSESAAEIIGEAVPYLSMTALRAAAEGGDH
jgi:hypothetical protein